MFPPHFVQHNFIFAPVSLGSRSTVVLLLFLSGSVRNRVALGILVFFGVFLLLSVQIDACHEGILTREKRKNVSAHWNKPYIYFFVLPFLATCAASTAESRVVFLSRVAPLKRFSFSSQARRKTAAVLNSSRSTYMSCHRAAASLFCLDHKTTRCCAVRTMFAVSISIRETARSGVEPYNQDTTSVRASSQSSGTAIDQSTPATRLGQVSSAWLQRKGAMNAAF